MVEHGSQASLVPGRAAETSKARTEAPQAIRLDLTREILDDILRTARAGGNALQVKFGKHPTINYGTKSQHLRLLARPANTELYTHSSGSTTDLALAGCVSHRMALQRAKEDSAGADEALARLQTHMAALQADRQSNAASLLPEGSKVLVQATQQSKASTLLKANHRRLLSHGTSRSLPASPSLSATRSPAPHTSTTTSNPASNDLRGQKLRAIRVPLIHLLAIRPVSARFLSHKIGCTETECKEVLQKVGQQHTLDASKYDLSKQAYKELDVWSFSYQSEEDRRSAIDRVISAFDRQRIGKEDRLWQMLLPREERGKGKTLSRLNLQAGQAKKATTPRIHVEEADTVTTAKKSTNVEHGKDSRLAPSDAEAKGRSQSQDRYKKRSVKEKEAQSKRILGTASNKPVAPSKVTKPLSTPAKRAGSKNASVQGKVKSAEYVHKSDDEDTDEGMPPETKPSVKPTSKLAAKKLAAPSAKQQPTLSKNARRKSDGGDTKLVQKGTATKKVPSAATAVSNSESKAANRESNQDSVPMAKSQSRQRNTSSPHKPSPLGSSPPANASDLDFDARSPPLSSASSTPLVAQSQKVRITSGVTTGTGQLRTPSDATLKRKANDTVTGIHDHSGLAHSTGNPAKRPKTSPMSPPTSDSSTGGKKVSQQAAGRDTTVDMARQFKKFYEKYFKVDQELRAMARPPPEKIMELVKMRDRLVQMKRQIGQGAVIS